MFLETESTENDFATEILRNRNETFNGNIIEVNFSMISEIFNDFVAFLILQKLKNSN